MTQADEILTRLARIFGERWWEASRLVAKRDGYVNVFLFRESAHRFSLYQNWDYKGCGVPAPKIVFRFAHTSRQLDVVSFEDSLDRPGAQPMRTFKTMEAVASDDAPQLQEELSRQLVLFLREFDGHRA